MVSNRIKLLFVIENACYGGGEKVFSLLIKNLPKDRFEVFCAAAPQGRFFSEAREHCKFIGLDLSNRFNFSNIGRLKSIMLENGIQLAHSQGARADFYCAMAAARAGIKAVSTVAMPVEGFDVGFARRSLYRFLNSAAEKRFHGFITVSKELEVRLEKGHGIPAAKIVLIPNPVDMTEFDPARFDASRVIEKFGLRGKLVIGALGRLEWQKGFTHLLDAVKMISDRDPKLKEKLICLIAGTGRLEAELKKKTAELGVTGNVIFCGVVDGVRDLLGALDIFVMPSLSEGQPLALLEAMAMAKPIVASDIPGISETARNEGEALLVKPGLPQELAEAIIKLSQDGVLARRLGAAARLKAGHFTLSDFTARHAEFYLKTFPGGA